MNQAEKKWNKIKHILFEEKKIYTGLDTGCVEQDCANYKFRRFPLNRFASQNIDRIVMQFQVSIISHD